MISVICCYNNITQFEQMRDSLKKQDIDYSLEEIDNRSNRFSSAAAALNFGAERSDGDILVFVHQDILFQKTNSLRSLTSDVDCRENTIIGIFGASGNKKNLQNANIVDTVDECCFAMTRNTWARLRFNQDICDGWHLYAVEMCLRLRKIGGTILCSNCGIQHLSTGNVNDEYMKTFKRLLEKYNDLKWIRTTCKSLPTNSMAYYAYYIPWKMKKKLFGNYPLMQKLKSR